MALDEFNHEFEFGCSSSGQGEEYFGTMMQERLGVMSFPKPFQR
jgi:hypothetical protein